MIDTMRPKRVTIMRRVDGIAGQFGYQVHVDWRHDDGAESHTHALFLHNTYGGPVVVIVGGQQVFIDRDVVDRCGGSLNVEFIERFYGYEKEEPWRA